MRLVLGDLEQPAPPPSAPPAAPRALPGLQPQPAATLDAPGAGADQDEDEAPTNIGQSPGREPGQGDAGWSPDGSAPNVAGFETVADLAPRAGFAPAPAAGGQRRLAPLEASQPRVLIQPPSGEEPGYRRDLSDLPTSAAMLVPGSGPFDGSGNIMTSLPGVRPLVPLGHGAGDGSNLEDLSLAAMVVDELAGTQQGPLNFPPEAPRKDTGEFSVIVRLRKENRRFLGLLLVGLPLVLAGIVALVLVARRQWFSPADLSGDAGAGAVADAGSAPARPVYAPDETRLRLESQFTMEPLGAGAPDAGRRRDRGRGGRRAPSNGRADREDSVASLSAQPDGRESPGNGKPAAAQPSVAAPSAARSAELALLARMERGRSELRVHVPQTAAAAAPRRSALAQADVQKVLHGSRSSVTRCLNRELKRSGGFGATRRVLITFMVQPSGRTKNIQLSQKVGTGYFQRCIVDVVSRMRFPAFAGDAQPVSYPLILTNSGF